MSGLKRYRLTFSESAHSTKQWWSWRPPTRKWNLEGRATFHLQLCAETHGRGNGNLPRAFFFPFSESRGSRAAQALVRSQCPHSTTFISTAIVSPVNAAPKAERRRSVSGFVNLRLRHKAAPPNKKLKSQVKIQKRCLLNRTEPLICRNHGQDLSMPLDCAYVTEHSTRAISAEGSPR